MEEFEQETEIRDRVGNFCYQIFDVSVQKGAEVAAVATGPILDSDKIASGDPNSILRPGKLMEVEILAVITERHGSQAGRIDA